MEKAYVTLLVCLVHVLAQQENGEFSMDELITKAANSSHQFDFMMSERSNEVRIELDMVYRMEDWLAIQALNASGSRSGISKRKAVRPGVGGYRWTNKIIPYDIASGVFNSGQQQQIQLALQEWMRYTCLTFRRATSSDRNRIRFNNGGGCFSMVGMTGGVQTVGLAWGCRVKSVIVHEVGHAVGFHHEQTRPDRDRFVTIVRRNIPSQIYYNFQKYTTNVINDYNVGYDYTSIMHYGQKAFSSNGGVTIVTKDTSYQNRIGKSQGLSFRDIKLAHKMYQCSASCTKSDSDCPGEGFVGKDCQCWCPGTPYKRCTGNGGGGTGTGTGGGGTGTGTGTGTGGGGTGTGTGGGGTGTGTGTGGRTCKDQNTRCPYWAGRGECRNNPAYMLPYCKLSCRRCTGGGVTPSCKDLNANCAYWSRANYCDHRAYRTYMDSNCRRSCNKCVTSATAAGTTTRPTTGTGCADLNNNCAYWAGIGQCRANPAYMMTSCKRSCHVCTSSAAQTDGGSHTCSDSNAMCSIWFRRGECTANPNYMLINCRRSCSVCSS